MRQISLFVDLVEVRPLKNQKLQKTMKVLRKAVALAGQIVRLSCCWNALTNIRQSVASMESIGKESNPNTKKLGRFSLGDIQKQAQKKLTKTFQKPRTCWHSLKIELLQR